MYKVMCIYDTSVQISDGRTIGWAYWRRCTSIQKYAPADFKIDVFPFKDVPWDRCGEYDLVYNAEYAAPSRNHVKASGNKTVLVVSFNSDSRRRGHFYQPVKDQADFICFNNIEAYAFYGKKQGSCCISNGVCSETFQYRTPIESRPNRLVWTGSTGPTKGKRYDSVFLPLKKLAEQRGLDVDLRPVNDIKEGIVLPTEEVAEWYNTASFVGCASESDATPNYLLEAAMCGAIPISTRVGNLQEFGVDRENCVFVDPTPESFLEGMLYASEHRERLSANVRQTMLGWSYGEPGNRAQYFYQLFRRLIEDGPRSIKPFSYNEISPDQI